RLQAVVQTGLPHPLRTRRGTLGKHQPAGARLGQLLKASTGILMTTASATRPHALQQVFNWLLADRLIDPKEAKAHYNQARSIQKSSSTAMHPLVAVAQCKLHPANAPQQLMTLDWLSEWLAKKTGLPFLRID